jgi:hypothetical protein
VTVLFPWVPMDHMTDEDVRALAAIFADTPRSTSGWRSFAGFRRSCI